MLRLIMTINFFLKKKKANLFYYLAEIRYRFFYFFACFFFTFTTCYYYSLELIYIIINPFLKYKKPFIFTELTEAFYTTLKICTIITSYLLFPICCYIIWSFIIPSYYHYERKSLKIFLFWSNAFFVFTLLLIYFFILPHIYDFLLQYEIKEKLFTIQLETRIISYVSWSSKILFFLAIFGQLPLICYLLFQLKILSSFFLSQNRKFVFCFFLVLAAFLSPPDFFTQWIMTSSLTILYESIIWLGFFHAACLSLPSKPHIP